jgi:hypothetical protein
LNVSGFCTYADSGAPCPTVNVNPGPFADEVIGAFKHFIHDLKHPNARPRANFRQLTNMFEGDDQTPWLTPKELSSLGMSMPSLAFLKRTGIVEVVDRRG